MFRLNLGSPRIVNGLDCHMFKKPPESYKISTSAIYWNIDSSLVMDYDITSNQRICSCEFSLGADIGKPSTWKIVLIPNHFEDGKRFISMSVMLTNLSAPHKHINILYAINLLAPESSIPIIHRVSSVRCFTPTDNTYGWNTFFPFEALGQHPPEELQFCVGMTLCSDPKQVPQSPKNNAIFTAGNSLGSGDNNKSILPWMKKVEPMEIDDTESSAAHLQSDKSDEILAQNAWKSLWISKKGTDVLIACRNRKFMAHSKLLEEKSCILAHPKYVRGMPVPLQGVEDKVMEIILEYIYTGEFNTFFLTNSTLFKLFGTALIYKVKGLPSIARDLIFYRVNHLTFQSILESMQKFKRMIESCPQMKEGDSDVHLVCETKYDLLRELLKLRETIPSILGDYLQNLDEYTVLIFGQKPLEPAKAESHDSYITDLKDII